MQTQYPTQLDSNTTLGDPRNNAQSSLASSITSSDVNLTLADGSRFPNAGAITIENEIIYYTNRSGNSLSGLTRGQESTTAAAHTSGKVVRMAITQQYHIALRDAVLALQSKIGVGDSSPSATEQVLCRTASGTTEWRLASDIPGISVSTGSDPNAVKTNTTGAQALQGSLDADRPTKTAAQIAALTPGRYGRDIYQTDGVKGFYRDYGATIGFRRALPYVHVYEYGIVPNASDSTTRTNNSTAWAALMTAIPARGARVVFPEERFYFAEDLEVSKVITIEGSGTSFAVDEAGTRIYVESGQNGFSFLANPGSPVGAVLRGVSVMTRSGYSGVTTGDGIYCEVPVRIENVFVSGFGRDGIHLRGTSPANCDWSSIKDIHSYQNKRDGLHLDGGGDTNVVTIQNPNLYSNGRHGLYNAGGTNTIIGAHASSNAALETAYDYYDNGTSNLYLNPYSEGGASAKIYLDSAAIYNTYIFGIFGAPSVVSSSPGINGAHTYLDRGSWRIVRLRDQLDAGGGLAVNLVSDSGHFYIQAGGHPNPLDYNASTEVATWTKLAYSDTLCASGTPQTLTGAGAVNVTTDTTLLVTTGANALTLADGAPGQIKKILMKTDGGDGTLTPTNKAGFSTIVFNDVGDAVTLQFQDGKWWIIGSYGVTIS